MGLKEGCLKRYSDAWERCEDVTYLYVSGSVKTISIQQIPAYTT